MIARATLVGVLVVIAVAAVGPDRVSGQSVSPKLDFDESQETENTSSTVRPTAGTDASGHGSRDAGTGKTGPKIHGVRVTVDTGDNQRGSKESKESVEITESKNKKRVGIHTDITFEISSDNDDSNVTSSGQKHDKEENDASVPIFKGRKSTTTSRPRKPYDPRMPWNPNQPNQPNHSGERRRGGDTPYRPHYPHNVPVYPGVNDRHGGGDEVYRGIDSWSNFVPITSTWTTERSYYEPYQPNSVGGYRAPSWKPCYCVSSSSSSEGRRRRDSTSRPTSSVIHVLDRLDSPFSSGRN